MTIKQEILAELRKGRTIAQAMKKSRSKSRLYEALTEYFPELKKEVSEKQQDLREINVNLSNAKVDLQKIQKQKDSVSAEAAKLKQNTQSLTAEMKNLSDMQNQLETEAKSLEAKGYSPTIMKKLGTIEATGPELLSRVKTPEQHKQLTEEVSSLKKRKDDLEGKVQALDTKRTNIEHSITSEKNTLDELKLQTDTYKKAMVAVDSLLKEGYSPEDIESLKHGLDVFGIKDNPVGSVKRLVKGLAQQKNIVAVKGKLERVTQELDEATEDLATVKNQLAMIKQATLKTIQEAQQVSIKALTATQECSTHAIAETEKQAEDGLKIAMEKLAARTNESVDRFDAQLQQDLKGHKTELEQITELERRRAEVETTLGPGLPLVKMSSSDEDLKKVPAPSVAGFLEGIERWLEVNAPKASARPTDEIHHVEFNLNTMRTYRLSTLVKLASLGLRQHTVNQANMRDTTAHRG